MRAGGLPGLKISFCRFRGGLGIPVAAEHACRAYGLPVQATVTCSFDDEIGAHYRPMLFTCPNTVDRGDIAMGEGLTGRGHAPSPVSVTPAVLTHIYG